MCSTHGSGGDPSREHEAATLLAEATPRPWEIDPVFVRSIGHAGSEGSEGEWDVRVAQTEDPEDAVLIVRAVNEYEALLAVADAARRVKDDGSTNSWAYSILRGALEAVDAAS